MTSHETERALPLLDHAEEQERLRQQQEVIRNLTIGAHPVGRTVDGEVVYSRPIPGDKVEMFIIGESPITPGKQIVFRVNASEVILNQVAEDEVEVRCEICNGLHLTADHN